MPRPERSIDAVQMFGRLRYHELVKIISSVEDLT